MIGSFEVSLQLTGTDPGGTTLATVPVTSGTITMDKGWAPAVQVRLVVPYSAFGDLTAWNLIEPTLSAKFCRLYVANADGTRQGLWELNLRSYRFDVKAGTVELVAYSYEALVQDYGKAIPSFNFTNTATWPSTLSIVNSLCQTAAGSDVVALADWTAPVPAAPIGSNEWRFVVPGSSLWDHVQGLAAMTPGGTVQHYGFGTDAGFNLNWLLTHPTYDITPAFAYEVPEEPTPEFPIGLTDATRDFAEWAVARSREADGWGNAMWVEYPNKQASGSVVFTTSGYVMDYEYNLRGTAGSTSAKRRQAEDTSTPRSTPGPSDRDLTADQRLDRAAFRAVGQTYTQPLDTRLLPWQRHTDVNSVPYMISTVMHNLADGTSVVTVNRL